MEENPLDYLWHPVSPRVPPRCRDIVLVLLLSKANASAHHTRTHYCGVERYPSAGAT
jgi:hypothetical protein